MPPSFGSVHGAPPLIVLFDEMPLSSAAASPDGPGTRQTLVETLETTMRLLHPFMPFLTEEIWQTLPHQGESIVIQRYPIPNPTWTAPEIDQRFTLLEQTIGMVRTSRVLLNYPPGQQITFYVAHDEPQLQGHLDQLRGYLAHLGRGTVDLAQTTHWPTSNLLRLVTDGLSVGIAVAGDVDLNKALDRIIKQQSEQTKEIERLEGKLGNQEFAAKAPPEVITDHQDRLTSLRRDQAMLTDSEQQLRAMLGT
ncbi:MAG: class I tRNA ligase family protein [Nitrospiraceae bacterium]|nr:class I tRNA ligase family protein [Nitrospiraceae bacterium]